MFDTHQYAAFSEHLATLVIPVLTDTAFDTLVVVDGTRRTKQQQTTTSPSMHGSCQGRYCVPMTRWQQQPYTAQLRQTATASNPPRPSAAAASNSNSRHAQRGGSSRPASLPKAAANPSQLALIPAGSGTREGSERSYSMTP